MSERYRCCPHCADALDDHVEHGGTVEKDGHDLPCSTCEFDERIAPLLAQARAEGAEMIADAVEALHRRLTGCDCDRGCAWPSGDGCAPPERCQRCQTAWPCPTIVAARAAREEAR
jgi:hypothetical protein